MIFLLAFAGAWLLLGIAAGIVVGTAIRIMGEDEP